MAAKMHYQIPQLNIINIKSKKLGSKQNKPLKKQKAGVKLCHVAFSRCIL